MPVEDSHNTHDREILWWYWQEGWLPMCDLDAYSVEDPELPDYFKSQETVE